MSFAGKSLGIILIIIGVCIALAAGIADIAHFFVLKHDPRTGETTDMWNITMKKGDLDETKIWSTHNLVGYRVGIVFFIGCAIAYGGWTLFGASENNKAP